ncbi:PQQ-binding-like beta-propeller repeat protein [Natronobacterium texcoconense]
MTQVDAPNFRSISSNGSLNWALKTSPGWGPCAPPPAVPDDRVILPDTPEAWVVESDTGGLCYRTKLHPSGVTYPFPVVADGRIHTGFQTFSLESGELLWKYDSNGPQRVIVIPEGEERPYPDGPTGVAPTVRDGTVYVAGTLYDGEIRFQRENSEEEGSTEERSSLVYSGEADGSYHDEYDEWGHIHALDAATGSLEWKTEFDTAIRAMTPPVATNDAIFVVDSEPRLHALDRTDGEKRWHVPFDVELISGWRPAVADGCVFLCAGNKVYAFDALDGAELWQLAFDTQLAGPPAIADGVVHVSTSNGMVAGIGVDGDRRWQLKVSESLRTGPVVTDGRLYVAGHELICLTGHAD